ncbi:MAG: AAA family ATPase [Candidatus Methanomethyliaceae archaeon]|nr:AAA family ATPase [Candidatus Methanomethyliaceae archaeon]MDW7970715.1 AAA family ATPase [Nitrososphaerota archaeon]
MSSFSLRSMFDTYIQLTSTFVNREWEAQCLLTSLISSEPAILVGPPGTAKTMMIEYLAKLTNTKYFYYLLTRFTEPDELLGPLDINALRGGEYKRITTNRLPEAEIIFLDEIFKASSAVRNILLDIMLNKRYLDGRSYIKLPTLTIYTASNEISTDEEDQAFYDRLTIRDFIKYVPSTYWDSLLQSGVLLMKNNDVKPILTIDHIKTLQDFSKVRAEQIINNLSLRNKIIESLAELKEVGIELSDRRKIKLVLVFSSISLIFAEEEPTLDSLADALRMVAINSEDDIKKIENVVAKLRLSSVDIQRITTLATETKNVINVLRQGEVSVAHLRQLRQLKDAILAELNKLPDSIRTLRARTILQEAITTIDEFIKSLGV